MKIITLFSGGLDSTCLLYKLLHDAHEVKCIGFDYGQRHKIELLKARQICTEADVEYRVCDLSSLTPFLHGSSQTDKSVPVPEGHFADESMKLTVVPNRNMIMLSIAIGWAISSKFNAVAYAAHTGDHTIYPDCRPEFVDSLRETTLLADWSRVDILTPFIDIDKAGCVSAGDTCNAPLFMTYSCYNGRGAHCGLCGACTERKEAFLKAKVIDPTTYERKAPKL